MPTQTAQPFEVKERVSAEISWVFVNTSGIAIQDPALLTATLTLYDSNSDIIVNSRDVQDILGLDKSGNNDVLIVDGEATWYVQPEDNAIVAGGDFELHIALIQWTWDPGDGFGIREERQEIRILVENMNHVP